MKEFHTLLPVRAQVELMSAVKSNLNETIKQVMFDFPYCFHTEESLEKRVFFDQPRGPTGNSRFVNPAPGIPAV
jgi:hypothetical protein